MCHTLNCESTNVVPQQQLELFKNFFLESAVTEQFTSIFSLIQQFLIKRGICSSKKLSRQFIQNIYIACMLYVQNIPKHT
jgi:hypothetical protein